jgi:hypothetical protein
MSYNPKSCNALQKPYYRPVEAAIRWCNLTNYEAQIMGALGDSHLPTIRQFPEWPCLAANTEKILDAIRHREIPHGRDGATVADGDHVAAARLTVRHNDLKAWMSKHFPDQKPDFLFDETEQKTHAAINTESFTALQADVQAANRRREQAEKLLRDFGNRYAALEGEHESLKLRNTQVELWLSEFDAKWKEREEEHKAEIAALKQVQESSTKKPDYMNLDHPHFSEELCDAVRTWTDTVKRNPEPSRFKSFAKAFLTNAGYDGNALERLSTVVNSDEGKRGGVPKKDP